MDGNTEIGRDNPIAGLGGGKPPGTGIYIYIYTHPRLTALFWNYPGDVSTSSASECHTVAQPIHSVVPVASCSTTDNSGTAT